MIRLISRSWFRTLAAIVDSRTKSSLARKEGALENLKKQIPPQCPVPHKNQCGEDARLDFTAFADSTR